MKNNSNKNSLMSAKPNTTAPLSQKQASNILKLLTADSKRKELLMFAIGFYTGFRISDILTITWQQLRDTDQICIKEKKTSKERCIQFNKKLKAIIKFCDIGLNGHCFVSAKHHTGKPMTIQGANKLIKRVFNHYEIKTKNASSHTLRKTFAYNLYIIGGKSEDALIFVSHILNHSTLSMTRRYLGITQKKIDKLILSLDF